MVRTPRFHTKPLRKQSNRRRQLLKLVTLIGIGLATLVIMRWPSGEWERVNTQFTLCGKRGSQGCVIDGDTIMIGRRKIRITDYNAPELKGECPAESALAKQSRDALRDWLNKGAFHMSDGDDPPYDQYGRELRALKRGEEWLSDVMLEQELAQESGWGFTRGGWCA